MIFWQTAQAMLSSKTREKVRVHGTDVAEALGARIPMDHPYLKYLLAVKGLSSSDRVAVPLPCATAFVPRWREALEADWAATAEVLRKEPSRQGETDLLS